MSTNTVCSVYVTLYWDFLCCTCNSTAH
jgi:hypothetical protein